MEFGSISFDEEDASQQ
ncbi:unnamed protein product, partial [Rotaria sp. Silwood2]